MSQTLLPSPNYPRAPLAPLHPEVVVSVLQCAEHTYIFFQYRNFKKVHPRPLDPGRFQQNVLDMISVTSYSNPILTCIYSKRLLYS